MPNLGFGQPFWVKNPPSKPDYYIGVGFATKKKGVDHQQEATRNALEKLLQTIELSISSEQKASTIEIDSTNRQEFYSLTRLSSAAEIASYEQVDTWDSRKEYWVYLRLSKEVYRDFQLERLNRMAASIPSYFVGVGQVAKKEFRYLEKAQDRALANLAKSISVSISAQNVMETIETTDASGVSFQERFSDAIYTETQAEIDGYEPFGSWEDEELFILFYRLSRARYATAEANKRAAAKKNAQQFYELADQQFANGDISASLINYVNTINALGRFIFEEGPSAAQENKTNLGIKSMAALQSILNETSIAYPEQAFSTTSFLKNNLEIPVTVNYAGKDLPNLTLSVENQNQVKAKFTETVSIGNSGIGSLVLYRVLSQDDLILNVGIDPTRLLSSGASAITTSLLSTLPFPSTSIKVNVKPVSFGIVSSESIDGEETGENVASAIVAEVLSKAGISVVTSDAAIFQVTVNAKANHVTEIYGMHSSQAQASVTISQDGQSMYTAAVNDVKGNGLDKNSSSRKAIEAAATSLAKKVLNEYLEL